ncbi:hypothetical protein Tco_0158210 [Tanacetum coccineum]
MSNSEDSTVTYTAVFSPYGGLSDIGSPGFVGPEHEGLPWMLDDPYVQSPPPPDFVPEPVYPEFMPPEDEILLAEEQYGDYRYSGNLSYENEISQSVFKGNNSDFENLPLHKRLAKTCEMQAVPPPMTGNYLPSRN